MSATDPSPPPTVDPSRMYTDALLVHLGRMRTWHTLFAVLCGLGAALMGLGALTAVVSLFGGNAGGLCTAPVYSIFGYVQYRLSGSLWSSSRHIRGTQTGADEDLAFNIEQAVRHQADFWSLSGTVTAIMLVLNTALLIGLLYMGGADVLF